METVKIIKRYEKETQTIQIVEDRDGDQYIQIMDEMYPDTPILEIDCHQAENLVGILNQAIKDIVI